MRNIIALIINTVFDLALRAVSALFSILRGAVPAAAGIATRVASGVPGVPVWPVVKIVLILAFIVGSFIAGHRVGRAPLPRVDEERVFAQKSLETARTKISLLEQRLSEKPKDALPVVAACPPAPKKEPARKSVRQARPAAAKKVTTNQSSVFPF